MVKESQFSSLSNLVAVVTGGSRGIGFGIAKRLAAMGASVVITARQNATAARIAGELAASGAAVTGFACDVISLSEVQALAGQIETKFGRLDILVNNAGIGGPSGYLHELPPASWDTIFHTNVRGAYYMIRELTPLMIRSGGGHIVNISSLAGKNPLPKGAAYSASKWALNGLSYSVAEELRPYNIRVSVVCPGSVDTDFSDKSGRDRSRMLRPDDVAHVVAMLVTQAPQSFVSEISMRPAVKP